ncbi:hypothetical protein ISF_02987 [Cordyceps fumosorosea ARSEF 2679]|uniref:Uncharacterized protein n=1 Tax=Cordyceps fumosorosea (strain ARSEF 2679) TaxID=1081104 RepID=A0A168B772_CORFA|nr:hypothetical protein ISF_02987 [Cordyceps fumosorosea ARSEF 2679]OAA69717.1 hypothetical protein ISF_02987 [Cordyceps fumosorosea ARSEF 2679]
MSEAESTTTGSEYELPVGGGMVKPASQVGDDTEKPDSASNMLSMNFSTPLAGPARTEKIKQMSKNHAAFEKSRAMQQILVKIQQSLRRMPGVSSAESSEMVLQLQEVGQVISRETSDLVNAVMNLTLDQEDTDKAVARMSIEANIAKARIDNQSNTIQKLEAQIKEMEGRAEQSQCGKSHEDNKDELIKAGAKALKDTNRHLEDQVNGRRALWVMKHPDEQSLARAIETMRDSADGFPVAQNALISLRQNITRVSSFHNNNVSDVRQDYGRPGGGDVDSGGITSPDFYARPSAQLPPIGGSLRGPARPPSAAPYVARRGNPASASASASASSSWDQPPAPPPPPRAGGGGERFALSSFSRAGSLGRRTAPGQQGGGGGGGSHFSPNATEFYPWNPTPSSSDNHPGGGGGGGRHASMPSFSNGAGAGGGAAAAGPGPNNNGSSRDYYPRTPTAASRGRYGRLQEAPPPSAGGSDTPGGGVSLNPNNNNNNNNNGVPSSCLVPAAPTIAPLVHMNERTVAAWHDGIMDFYAVIRAFVERHTSQPDHASSMKMSSTGLWPILLATYHPLSPAEAASYLEYHLRNENSKACLVTRVMIDYIVNRVWTPAAWSGADDESTYSLMELERDMERMLGQPSAFRQPLLDRQAAIIDGILAHEHDSSFHKCKVDEVAGTLLANLQPLLNRLANPADACRDMAQVAEHAWALSSRILTSRLTFDFRFPEIGSRFSSQSMLPIWPRMDPYELQAKHWRVALVTTPVITCRNDTGTNISAHSVSLADVFCMH